MGELADSVHQRHVQKTEVLVDEKAISSHSSDQVHTPDSDDGSKEIPFEKSPAEKKLVRKISYTLMPFVSAIIFIQFADKSTLSIAAVLGMTDDTHLSGSQYSWLGSFFYLGFICFQIPNNYFLQKFPIGRYLGTVLFCWGVIMACTSLCNNFAQLAACRFLLGIFEAATYPSLLLIINTLYRRSEQSAAYGFLWFSNGVGTLFGAAGSLGITYINNARGIASWRWLYIIYGSLAALIGILAFLFLADSPNAKILKLTDEEKVIIEDRTRDNAVVRVKKIKMHHVWEAVREPRLWLLAFSTLCNNLHTGGLVVFSTLIVRNLGFTSQESILLQIPGGLIAACFSATAVLVARKTGQLFVSAAFCSTISLLGVILLATLPNTRVKLLGYFIAWAMNGTSVMLLTLAGANVVGYTKKIFYNGTNMIFYTLGNFIGPLLMLEREAPVYKTGMIIYCVGVAAIIVMLFINRQLQARENARRLAIEHPMVVDVNEDLTDKENTTFIYKL